MELRALRHDQDRPRIGEATIMQEHGLVLAPCHHAMGDQQFCIACKGSGWVKVVPGEDGKPQPCHHGGRTAGNNCAGCDGCGWAGLVRGEK